MTFLFGMIDKETICHENQIPLHHRITQPHIPYKIVTVERGIAISPCGNRQ